MHMLDVGGGVCVCRHVGCRSEEVWVCAHVGCRE